MEPDGGQPKPRGLRMGPDWYAQNPQAKMSFTRLATWRRCPAWYRHQYLDWHRAWSLPVLRAGHVVQAVLEKIFDNEPGPDVTLESLFVRALERANRLFAEAFAREAKEHERDPNGFGPWDLPRERYEAYVATGLRWHLEEVKARLLSVHPRSGERLDLPRVESVAEAWKSVRPWHPVKAHEGDYALETVPRGFFQGQYDLVYTWTGRRRIIDLKASGGKSLFSSEIQDQLLSYAWMERALGRGEPEGLEGWFLGQSAPLICNLPSATALDAFEAEVVSLIEVSASEEGYGRFRREDFDPAPKSVPGVPAFQGAASAWCEVCPAALVCPKSGKSAPPAGMGIDFREESVPRSATIEGIILGISEPRTRAGKTKRRVTLANQSGVRTMGWDVSDVDRFQVAGLRAGRVVRVRGLNTWRPPGGGDPQWFPTAQTTLDVLSESWTEFPSDPES